MSRVADWLLGNNVLVLGYLFLRTRAECVADCCGCDMVLLRGMDGKGNVLPLDWASGRIRVSSLFLSRVLFSFNCFKTGRL